MPKVVRISAKHGCYFKTGNNVTPTCKSISSLPSSHYIGICTGNQHLSARYNVTAVITSGLATSLGGYGICGAEIILYQASELSMSERWWTWWTRSSKVMRCQPAIEISVWIWAWVWWKRQNWDSHGNTNLDVRTAHFYHRYTNIWGDSQQT